MATKNLEQPCPQRAPVLAFLRRTHAGAGVGEWRGGVFDPDDDTLLCWVQCLQYKAPLKPVLACISGVYTVVTQSEFGVLTAHNVYGETLWRHSVAGRYVAELALVGNILVVTWRQPDEPDTQESLDLATKVKHLCD
jgi:hypothetical protein